MIQVGMGNRMGLSGRVGIPLFTDDKVKEISLI
jgi:hypothetical protein